MSNLFLAYFAAISFHIWLDAERSVQSGYPLSITQSSNNSNAYSIGQRPNPVAGQAVLASNALQNALSPNASDGGYFNPAAFSTARAGTFGTLLRTFSKIYGMAGLRAGAAIARPDLLAKLRPWGAGALPVTGMVAATASLKAKTLIAEFKTAVLKVKSAGGTTASTGSE